jgi:antitoxin component YwqK of YwqJK toxin-antitoxin module
MKRILFCFLLLTAVVPIQIQAQKTATEEKNADTLNRKNSNGEKYGPWNEKVGEITFKGEYVAGRKVKDWIGYYPNNVIFKVEYYDNGLKDGISIQFDRKCKISLVEHYKNGLAHGQTILYSQYNENPVSETEYAFGKKNGLYRQYYENMKIQEESWYKDDLKNGISRWNNKNGQRVAEYNYKAGNFDGLQKTFYDNDTLQAINNYQDNRLSGESREYYRNGMIKLSGKFVNGLKEGAWTEYDELGKVEKVIRYKNGMEQNKK